MVSGITMKKYPNNLLRYERRPIQSNVVARKIVGKPTREDLGINYALLLRNRETNKYRVAFVPPKINWLEETRPMSRQQAKGIYGYVRDTKSYEGVRNYFGLFPKKFTATQSERRKITQIYSDFMRKKKAYEIKMRNRVKR